jgi:hypothetical protein
MWWMWPRTYSDYWLEQELRPHDSRSPMDSNYSPQPQPLAGPGSTDSDNPHPLPAGSSPPAHNDLPDLNDPPQSSLLTAFDNLNIDATQPSLATAHNNLDIDSNATPQPSLPVNSESHPVPVGPPPPAHNNLNIDLNAIPHWRWQPSQKPTGSSDSDSHSTASGSSTDENGDSDGYDSDGFHSMGSESSSDVTISPSAWYEMSVFEYPKSPGTSPPHDSSDFNLNHPLSSSGPTDDQPPLAPPSDPGSSERPYVPSDPGPSTWQYPPSDPGPSTWAHPPSDPGPSTWTHPPSDPGPSTWTHPPSDPGPSTWANPPSDSGPSTPPPSSTEPLPHDLENAFGELFKDRLKRRISGPRSGELQPKGTLDSREYVFASAFPLPSTFQLP